MRQPKARTWWRSSLAVFGIALLASIAIHLPIYEVLGVLAGVLLHEPAQQRNEPIELELAPLADATEEPPEEVKPEPKADEDPEPEQEQRRAPPSIAKREPPEPKPEAEPEPEVPVPAVPVPAQPPIEDNPLAVTQKSEDPDAPPPENPRFVAEENRRVEEETIARVRNMHRDDPEPTPSTRSTAAPEDEGDAEDHEVADLQDLEGSDERTPDAAEAEHRPEHASQSSEGQRDGQAVSRAAPSAPAPSPAVTPQTATGAPETGGEPETLVVQDGSGSFVIRKAPKGRGPDERGGEQEAGAPSDEREQRAGARARTGTGSDLRVKWSTFEHAFGEQELREQREAYVEQRRSRTRGGDRKRDWRKFRAALENFVPNVRPGSQTALNAAASPFAHYLATVHRRIHREFAHRFIGSLPIAGGPYGDRSLHAELEIVINGDGTLHQVGIAKTSGFLPFDYGAFNAVMRASPYPPPPRKILSGDGRVYVHWGFYRNERQCGTFNARPFILPNPAGTPAPGQGPLQDGDVPSSPQQPGPGVYDAREGELGVFEWPSEHSAPRARHAVTTDDR